MKHVVILTGILLASFESIGQINVADSSVQVISFWNRLEKQSYTVSTVKTKLKGTDTTSVEKMFYDVDVTVADSTANSYTIEWLYKNFNANTDNKFVKRLTALSENMRVVIKTDELGMFKEVVNVDEVRSYITKSLDVLKKDFREVPKIDEIVNQVSSMFSSKEAIESAAIADIQQYHNFHGAKYTLGERLTGQTKTANLVGGDPFDTALEVYLDEINEEDNNYILRSSHTVNSEQLTNATYQYLVKISKNMGVPGPKREDLPPLTNEILIASRIHGSGWVIYSVETKTVTSGDVTSVEERVMEIR